MTEEVYCCEQFKNAVKTMNVMFFEYPNNPKENRWQIEGYDMAGVYPDLNYCPNCGKKLDKKN